MYRRTSDPELRYLAFDIMTTQQGQIGIMNGWLQLWRQTQTDTGRTAMAWMNAPHDGPMPGMATAVQIEELSTASVPRMEEDFRRLMIRHHRGALPMAGFAARHADSPDMRSPAGGMLSGQASEIEAMQNLLVARGAAAEPEGAAHLAQEQDETPPPAGPTHEGHR